jgi:hypothetical protein
MRKRHEGSEMIVMGRLYTLSKSISFTVPWYDFGPTQQVSTLRS